METIRIAPLRHRNALQVGVFFPFSTEIKNYVKSFPGMTWSRTHSCFYFLDTSESLKAFRSHIAEKGWFLNDSAYKKIAFSAPKKKLPKPSSVKNKNVDAPYLLKQLPESHHTAVTHYYLYLRGLRLSENTVKVYGYFIVRFLYFLKHKPLQDLRNKDVRDYLEQVIAKEKYSISSHRQCVSALKHFAKDHPNTEMDLQFLERPKKDKKLPVILSKEEVIDLLRVTKNLKHRTILAMLYSGGLRIGELLSLRLQDIDLDRMQVHVKRAKGRKDRTVKLAQVMRPLLYNYVQTYAPSFYLIEGTEGSVYSSSSVRAFLQKSCQLAKIRKRVTPHTLRHSYATHMMDNGVALRHIQELLGHAKPETTMVYTHVSQQDLLDVQNPLDATMDRLTKNDKEVPNVSISRKLL